MIELKEKYSTWRENIKLAFQGAALGACVVCFYFLFWIWGETCTKLKDNT